MKKAKLIIQALFISFVIGSFLIAGCESTIVSESDDGVLADNSIIEMSPLKTIKMVPYKGTGSGSGGFDITRDDCPEGTVAISGTGSGVTSHLGKVEVYFSHCAYYILDESNPNYVDGYGITTAANGDQVFGTYYGELTGPDTFVNYNTITDGTGRFENITGAYTEYGTVAFTDTGFDFEIIIEGEISSVGSNK
ncbi:MAG TPA: hypothetical protein VJ951_06085 [Bacteroidales bacterium]|nr:hypothetical protein [Bacteroidales bacterium]